MQPGTSAASSRDLPDHFTIFVLFTLLDSGIIGVCIDRVFIAMQQFGNLGDIGHIRGCPVDVVNQP
jgi:hypothetical protein